MISDETIVLPSDPAASGLLIENMETQEMIYHVQNDDLYNVRDDICNTLFFGAFLIAGCIAALGFFRR